MDAVERLRRLADETDGSRSCVLLTEADAKAIVSTIEQMRATIQKTEIIQDENEKARRGRNRAG